MAENMVEVWLYGKLRRFAPQKATNAPSIVNLPLEGISTIGEVLDHIGIAPEETSNIFLNCQLSALTRQISPGDRLGIFPNDMALLYKWYFRKET
jgi:hypothetical protein